MSKITQHYDEVLNRMAKAAQENGRPLGDIQLLAVSKTFPAESILELYKHGVRAFGENRAAELAEKATALPADIEWHFIGHLQANKVRKVVQIAQVIHSVDSLELLTRLDRIAGEEGKRPMVLLEVNVSGEESKSGVKYQELEALAAQAVALPHIDFKGFMTMAPLAAEPYRIAAIFELLKRACERIEKSLNCSLPVLSMGMSNDFEIAIRHGASLLRVGSLIFGQR